MINPGKSDKGRSENDTSSKRRSIEGLEELESYKRAIRAVYDGVMDIDWQQEYKDIKKEVASIDVMLRDVMKNVGQMDRMAVGKKIKLHEIIQNLSNAWHELNLARDKAEGKNIQTNPSVVDNDDKYAKVLKCRQFLGLAEDLMVLTRRTIDKE